MGSRSRLVGCGCLVIVLLLGLLVVVGSSFVVPVSTPVLGELRFRCSLGLSQTNASVTLRGPFAGHGCRRLLDQTSILPVRFVEISQPSDAPVVCSFTERYVQVTVRDPGVLQLLGDNLCTVVRDIVMHVAAGQRLADTTVTPPWSDRRIAGSFSLASTRTEASFPEAHPGKSQETP